MTSDATSLDRARVLAVASGGGHWTQLHRLRSSFSQFDTAFVSTNGGLGRQVPAARFYTVSAASRWERWRLLRCALELLRVLVVERPDVVVTTGAAPGYLALRLGRVLGARTIWIDSIANADELSMSGRLALATADLSVTQWRHLADDTGPHFYGTVLGPGTDDPPREVVRRSSDGGRSHRVFVTVGTELAFDRLVTTVDDWAGSQGSRHKVVAQIGSSAARPRNIEWSRRYSPQEFAEQVERADVLVGHAGIGTILAALGQQTPLIVLPRRADLGEHRNEHQLATARRLGEQGLITVVPDEQALRMRLDQLADLGAPRPIGSHADPTLLAALNAAIEELGRSSTGRRGGAGKTASEPPADQRRN